MELISKLGIDLKLLIAQLVNFFILFFVLSALLYKPILKLLDKRKKMIEKSVEDAKNVEVILEKLEVDKKKILTDASNEAMAVLEKAKHDAATEHAKILEKAKKDVSALAEKYRLQLSEEKNQLVNEVKHEVADLIVAATEKILRKEFSREDQGRLEEAIKKELKSVKQ